MATADEVRAAYDQLTAAANVLADVRNARVRVMIEWQQIGDVPADVVAGLERAVAAAARDYLTGQPVLSDVNTNAKSDCMPTLERDQLLMSLPVLWSDQRRHPIDDEAKVRAALWAAAPGHDWSMPHDARHNDWQACPPNCPHLVYVVAHGLHEARPAEPARVP